MAKRSEKKADTGRLDLTITRIVDAPRALLVGDYWRSICSKPKMD